MLLTMVSFNVNGLRNNLTRKTIFHFLKNKKFDFVLQQETHSNHTDEKLWKCEWEGDIFYSHGNNHSNGVAILAKKYLKCKRKATYIDQAGRILLIEIKFNEKVFAIGNVYAPTKHEPTFFDAFFFNSCKFFKTWLGFWQGLESSA